MSQLTSLLLLALVLTGLAAPAVAAVDRGSCEWRSPAHDPYVGSVPEAVDRYTDIPAATRARLKARMQQFAYDDIVAIRRDSIEGQYRYEPALLDMHFGRQRLCGNVTRQSWSATHEERGLAYCEDGHCIVVPTVCRNVSRIIRKTGAVAMGGPAAAHEPLAFDPPAAGAPPQAPGQDAVGPTVRTLEAAPPTVSRLEPPAADGPAISLPAQPPTPAAETPTPVTPTLPSTPELPPVVTITPPIDVPGLLPQPEPGPPFPAMPAPAMPHLPPLPPVPEPATVLLWTVGLAAGAVLRRRQRAAEVRATPR